MSDLPAPLAEEGRNAKAEKLARETLVTNSGAFSLRRIIA
jgi:hypothetical protein